MPSATERGGEEGRRLSSERLVTVHEAESEMEALTLRAFLEDQGIEAAVRSRQIPMYDGIAKVWNPVWGYVMVLESDGERARELLSGYLEGLEGAEPVEDDAD